jgi:hypothetical protein
MLGAIGTSGVVPGIIIGLIAIVFFILLLLIFILYQLIVLIFGLFKCYVTLLFQIIFAPILISIGIFPGSKTDFSSWLKQIMSNLLVFPAVYLFLIFMNVLIFTVTKGYADSPGNITNELWAPGVISWGSGFGIQLALSLTGFLLAAKIPTVLPQVLFNIKPSPWGQAMEQSYGSMMKSPFAGGIANKAVKRFEGAKEQSRDLEMKRRAYTYESAGAGLSDTQFRVAEDFQNQGFKSIFTKYRVRPKRIGTVHKPGKTK